MKQIKLKDGLKEFFDNNKTNPKKLELEKELHKINQSLSTSDIQGARKTLDNLIMHIDYLFEK